MRVLPLGWIASMMLTGSALAAEPKPAPDVYETLLAGTVVGTETATRTVTPTGGKLKSRIDLTVPQGAIGFVQEASLDGTGTRITSYRCDIEAGGVVQRVRAVRDSKGWTVDAGLAAAPEPQATKTFPAGPSTLVIDNNMASHLDLLCRDLARSGAPPASVTAIVPQALAAIPGKITSLGESAGKLDGASVTAVEWRLEMANVLIDLDCRKGDGAFLGGKVPIQKAEYRRKGYEAGGAAAAAAAAAEAPDPRERATGVTGPAGELAAVLTVPASPKAVPGVVLLSGSGPNDRDETIGPNKPFRDIARGLADRGIASLRFDKRTVTVKDLSKASTLRDEYVVDALEAVKQLRAAPGVDPNRIFVLGHSEGTLVAPVVAREAEGIRGIVLIAGPARPLDVLIHDQIAFQMKNAGQDDDAVKEQTSKLDEAFARIRKDPSSQEAVMGAPAAYWRDVFSYDLPKLLAESKLPVLVLQGEKDVQVSKTLDFDAMRARVGDAAGRVTWKSFPDLNHLMMPAKGTATGAEYGIAGHVDPAVMAAIAEWILAR